MRTDDSSLSAAQSMRPWMGDGEPLTPFRTVSIILTQLLQVIPAIDCFSFCIVCILCSKMY
jgi:hypothetical protein